MLGKEEKLKKIFEAIEKNNISAYELAKATGLNESGINRFVKGKIKSPHNSTVETLYNHFYKTNKEKSNTRIELYNKEGKEATPDEVGTYLYQNFDELVSKGTVLHLKISNLAQEIAINILKNKKDV